MVTAFKVACKEKMKRQVMKRELDELKGEFAKLKGMVCLTVASLNLQNHGTPTEGIQDVFNPQIMEELLEEEEVPQENIMAIPVPGLLLEILHTLQEILPSPGPLLRQFLSEPIIITSSIPPLGSSPQLLHLLVEDSTVGVGVTVKEFEEAVSCEAEMVAMVEALVELEDEPLTNDPNAVGELLEAWDMVVDTSPVEGDFVDWYDLCRHSSCQSSIHICNGSYSLVILVSCGS